MVRELVQASELQPGDVIGAEEHSWPAAVVYRVSSVSGQLWALDAVALDTWKRLEMRAWGPDVIARYRP